jgi:hypothetical protein
MINSDFYKLPQDKIQRRQICRMRVPRNVSPSAYPVIQKLLDHTVMNTLGKVRFYISDWKTIPTMM